jgi:spore maturation protein CgeB
LDLERVAVIYDDRQRPETTGVYCLRALGSLVRAVHFRPDDLASLSPGGFDLYLNIDDGLEYHLPASLRPSAWWAIDTHINFGWCRRKALDFDFVFAAQRDGAARLEAEGIAAAHWLPLACDPTVHRAFEVDKTHDIAFVGNVFPGPRAELINLLRRRFRSVFVGRAYFEEMAKVYSAARLAFNRSIENDVNMRVFEAVACGSLLMTNDLAQNGQADLFRDGVHLATYRDADELLHKAAFYLKHDAHRERIADAGRAEAATKHTYLHRMQAVLERVSRGAAHHRRRRAQPAEAEVTPLSGYYEFDRPELVALVPASARRVLDVGCGAGRLGEAIKARQPASVVGIELAGEAAARARGRLDKVYHGDAETLELPFGDGAFDCVVCGDVLEHLCEPGEFLRRVRSWLAPDGCIVASLPNVRHHSVVSALLEGNWSYEPAGLLDETHLHFFARRDMIDLFERAGFRIENLQVVPGPGYDEWRQMGRPGEVRVGRLQIADNLPEEAEEFFVYQYLIVARPNGPAERKGAVVSAGRDVETVGLSAAAAIRIAGATRPAGPRESEGALRIAFLGNFEQSWSTEGYAADALERVGHLVHRIHEYGVVSAEEVLNRIDQFRADCLLFFKGRIGVDPGDAPAVLRPDPSTLVELLRRSPVPAYLWYYDRVHNYHAEPSRLEWMRQVAPHCRVAFVTDGGLATTDWANWYVLRQGVSLPTVAEVDVPESQRADVAFLGQLYGGRWDELAAVRQRFNVDVVSGVFGRDLSRVIRGHRIIIGPRYPSAPGYWSDRVYVVLGHGGFFLAPEVPGMREECFEPGVHFAALGDDPVADVRHWLDRADQRERIARQGQALVLGRFTYEHRVREMSAEIARTIGSKNGEAGPPGGNSPHTIASPRSYKVGNLRFRHRRKLGDVIYSLPAMRQLGGGTLYLDPTSLDGAQDRAVWKTRFAGLIPFLEQQAYIREVRIHDGEPFDVDLDAYLRTTHGTVGDRVTIAANHFVGLGLELPNPMSPWLTADNPPAAYPVVLHRSYHYHGVVDYSFLLDFREKLYCVGADEERRPFEAIGAKPLVTRDVRELAAVVNRCGVFIGNQSLPLALAIGLGKRRMIEESDRLPNCTFGAPEEFVMTRSARENAAGLRRLLCGQQLSPPAREGGALVAAG